MPARLHVSPSPLHVAAAPHPTLHEKVCRNIVLWLHITCPMSLSKPPKTKGLAAVALGLGVDPSTKSCTGPAPGPGPAPPGPPPPPRPPVPAGQCSAPMDGMSLVYGDSKKPSSYPTTDTAEACVVRVSPSPRLPVSPACHTTLCHKDRTFGAYMLRMWWWEPTRATDSDTSCHRS